MTTLASELEAFLAEFSMRIPPDVRDVMLEGDNHLRDSGVEERALKPGASAPDFALENQDGDLVRLQERLREGPVILSFYRGGWCPYCNLELRAWRRERDALKNAGASLIAISPQAPDATRETALKNDLGFDVVSDTGSRIAGLYGVAFELPESLRKLYTRFGHALPAINGSDDWRLPMPATFVIARTGAIVLAHASVDYRKRLEPSIAIDALMRPRAHGAS